MDEKTKELMKLLKNLFPESTIKMIEVDAGTVEVDIEKNDDPFNEYVDKVTSILMTGGRGMDASVDDIAKAAKAWTLITRCIHGCISYFKDENISIEDTFDIMNKALTDVIKTTDVMEELTYDLIVVPKADESTRVN